MKDYISQSDWRRRYYFLLGCGMDISEIIFLNFVGKEAFIFRLIVVYY